MIKKKKNSVTHPLRAVKKKYQTIDGAVVFIILVNQEHTPIHHLGPQIKQSNKWSE